MLPKSYILAKWSVYSLATLLLCFVQDLVLDHISLWGIYPFLYPILAALIAMYEGQRRGVVFALLYGILCSLLLPAPFHGFYAILFPLIAIFASGIAGLISPGWLCGLLVSLLSMLLTGIGHVLVGLLSGSGSLLLMVKISILETIFTLPIIVLALPMYRFIHNRCAAAY